MPKTRFIVNPDGVEAQFRLIPNNEEEEEGEINDEDDDDVNDSNNCDNQENNTGQNKDKIDPQANHICLSEMQAFLVALILPEPRLSNPPKWCRVLKCMRASNVGIFILDNAELDWIDDPGSKFTHAFKFKTSPDWIDRLVNVPMSRRQQSMVKQNIAPEEYETNFNAPTKVSRTELLLSPVQMIAERYPLPTEVNTEIIRSKFKQVTEESPIFALDCEMCLTVGNLSELTRISIVDEEMRVVYNQLVKPDAEIINYLTKYSGITPAMMSNVKTKLEDVHEFLRNNLPRDSILCGHSLNNDLKALRMFHPYVIDTSVIYNKSGYRVYKPSLKSLAYEYLNKDIQLSSKLGHNSLEDAMTAMELLKLKMVNGILFGDTLANDYAQGVIHDSKTGIPYLSIDKFIERQKVVQVAFRYIDTTPGARCIYIHDEEEPVGEDVKEAIFKLLDAQNSVCVVLTSNGLCHIKI